MRRQHLALGRQGEQIALAHLKERGYQIIATNWHCREGEIDIIAEHRGILRFIEVRTRSAETTETAFESVQPRKRARLIAAAERYLTDHRLENSAWCIDLLAIAVRRQGAPLIEYQEDALDW
ncbi:MAG: YraN family protein [Aggregatilineales bacterium]